MKKKLITVLTAGLFLFGMVGVTSATMFTLDDYQITTESFLLVGLHIVTTDVLTTPHSKDLSAGDSYSFDLFTIGSTEPEVNIDDWFPRNISVSLSWTDPDNMLDSVTGTTRGLMLPDLLGFDIGKVEWDGITDFYFGNGGHFTIGLSDKTFSVPGSTTVVATLDFLSDPAPVPEPTTLLLFGTGLAGLAGRSRIRRKKK